MILGLPGPGECFRDRVSVGGGPYGTCWLWTGAMTGNGYGSARFKGRTTTAHRAVYQTLVEEVPATLDLDHLCRERRCVNPAHLEPVTRRENMRRSPLLREMQEHGAAGQRNKTHCLRGHPFSGENLYVRRDTGARQCRACRKMQRAAWGAR